MAERYVQLLIDNTQEIYLIYIIGNDKNFLLSIEEGKPDWSIYNFQDFPAVQWKLKNIEKLKSTNLVKHRIQIDVLKAALNNEI